ncbi:MAG TPA: biotin transporter BioY [Myxococcota bacterium]|nr:biotin transporter BioY [Myxococcota bacterium]
MAVDTISIRPADVTVSWHGTAARVVAFVLLTALGAMVRIPLPFTPVPLTLQTFAVMLAGFMLTPRAAFASQALYVIGGLSGLPFLTVAATGTIGYLAGFVIAAPVVSLLSHRGNRGAATFAGVGIIHLCGCAGLSLYGVPTGIGLFVAGSLPFLPGDMLKALVAARFATRR